MKKLLYLFLMLFSLALYADENQVAPAQSENDATDQAVAQEIPIKPVITSESLLHTHELLEAMQKITADKSLQLVIYHPVSDEASKIALELQDKLVSLGLPSRRIKLFAQETPEGNFEFDIVTLTGSRNDR